VRIRELAWSDFPDMVRTYYECYDERERGFSIGVGLFRTRPTMEHEVDWFAEHYKGTLGGRIVSMVAEEDGHVVGTCSVNSLGPETEQSHIGELGILLRSEFRGRGVGEQLMRAAIDRCRGKFEMIQLDVFADNDRAKHLYRRLGFETTGKVPRAVRRGERYIDVERMVLMLAPSGPGPLPAPRRDASGT
jgi:ribosomal protein S18 acetylase RimI-like enzyme